MIDFGFDIDWREGVRSFSAKELPMYKIYMNGREYEMRETEALFLSGKIQRFVENDETANVVNIELKKEDVFGEYDIGEAEFEKVLNKSFERILNTIRNIFKNNHNNIENVDDNREMSLEELCCTKAILDKLESKSLKVKECKYEDIEEIERLGKEKAIEILNVIGSEKSIEYVGKHLMEIKEDEGKLIGKISPGRLEEVLRSEGVRVRGEGDILRVVEESIGVYGWGAGFLLGSVEANLLSWRDRNRYVELISQYISAINDINENNNDFEDIREYRRYNTESDNRRRIERKWKGRVEIEGEIVESLLQCVGNNGREGLKDSESQSIDIRDRIIEVGERMRVSDSQAQFDIAEKPMMSTNLNEYFEGRINVTAKTTLSDSYKPENVLIPGDQNFYHSDNTSSDGDQWIQFDFPEEICAKKLCIMPYGGEWNPRRLKIESVNEDSIDQIGVAEFPHEDRRTYTFQTTKEVWTKSIRIRLDGNNYYNLNNNNKYTFVLMEVDIYGYD